MYGWAGGNNQQQNQPTTTTGYRPTTSSGFGLLGGTTLQPTGRSVTTRNIAPSGERPSLDVEPLNLEGLEIDPSELSGLTQELLSPAVRNLQSGLQAGLKRAYQEDNPNVGALYAGNLMKEYGSGISGAYGGAMREARGIKQAEQQFDYTKKLGEWQSNAQIKQAEFNAAMADYNRGYGTETISTDIYPETKTNRKTGLMTSLGMIY
jgi:hypothetical protein